MLSDSVAAATPGYDRKVVVGTTSSSAPSVIRVYSDMLFSVVEGGGSFLRASTGATSTADYRLSHAHVCGALQRSLVDIRIEPF